MKILCGTTVYVSLTTTDWQIANIHEVIASIASEPDLIYNECACSRLHPGNELRDAYLSDNFKHDNILTLEKLASLQKSAKTTAVVIK